MGAFIDGVVHLVVSVFYGAVFILVVVFGFGYPLVLWSAQFKAVRRRVAIEGATLVQRNKTGRIVATIDLTMPFAARYMNEEADWILYRVTQGQRRMWLAVPSDGDGALVRALGLTWPPRVPFFGL